MAERSRNPLLLVTGRHTVAYTRLFRADFPEALRMADAGLEHFDFDQEKAIATEFQLSSTVCLRQSRAQALWMLGRVAEADDEAERMLAARPRTRPPAQPRERSRVHPARRRRAAPRTPASWRVFAESPRSSAS